jgi:hypothetical protein
MQRILLAYTRNLPEVFCEVLAAELLSHVHWMPEKEIPHC